MKPRSALKRSLLGIAGATLALALSACGGGGGGTGTGGGGGGGDGGGSGAATTTISGKVTLSSTLTASKPGYKVQRMLGAPSGKPGTRSYEAAAKASTRSAPQLPAYAAGDSLNNALVALYDSDHPEWLAPVAQTSTDDQGNFTLSVLANAEHNGNSYTDGEPIPAGRYTLLAVKLGQFDLIQATKSDDVVALQTVVKSFGGTISGNDLVAQPSDVTPTVESMLGVHKNTDGTNTWGSASLELPSNAAIQVSFSMAVSRGSLSSGIDISPQINGRWTLSSDWLTATFYPDQGESLQLGQTYTARSRTSTASRWRIPPPGPSRSQRAAPTTCRRRRARTRRASAPPPTSRLPRQCESIRPNPSMSTASC